MPEKIDSLNNQSSQRERSASRNTQKRSLPSFTNIPVGRRLAPPSVRSQTEAVHGSQDRSPARSPFERSLSTRDTFIETRGLSITNPRETPRSSLPLRQSSSAAANSVPTGANPTPFRRTKTNGSSSRDRSPSSKSVSTRPTSSSSERVRRLAPSGQCSKGEDRSTKNDTRECLTSFQDFGSSSPSPAEHPAVVRLSRTSCHRARSSATGSSREPLESSSPCGLSSQSLLENPRTGIREHLSNSQLLQEGSLSDSMEQEAAPWGDCPEDDLVSELLHSIDLHDSEDEMLEQGWDLDGDDEMFSTPDDCRALIPPPRRTPPSTSELLFDDAGAVNVDPDVDEQDGELEKSVQILGYEALFTSPRLQETYQFERDYPNAAPILRRLCRMPARVRRSTIKTSQQATITWKNVADAVERRARAGRIVYDEGRVVVRGIGPLINRPLEDIGPLLMEALEGTLRGYEGS